MNIELVGYSVSDTVWLATAIRKAVVESKDDGLMAGLVIGERPDETVTDFVGNEAPFIRIWGTSPVELEAGEKLIAKVFEDQSHAAASYNWDVEFALLQKYRRF